MTSPFNRKHLRLVSNSLFSNCDNAPCQNSSFDHKVESPDFEKTILYFVREVDVLRNSDFVSLLVENNTCCFFDVRVAPRLDFMASNRVAAFRKFDELMIDYVDIVGDLGIANDWTTNFNAKAWLDIVMQKISSIDTRAKSLFFVFDSAEVLRRADSVLPSLLDKEFHSSSLRFEVYSGSIAESIAM